jgi:hypothetical protein
MRPLPAWLLMLAGFWPSRHRSGVRCWSAKWWTVFSGWVRSNRYWTILM